LQALWLCECDCGNRSIVDGPSLRSENTHSCGCTKVVHGLSRTPEYHVWRQMLRRCSNPRSAQYKDYGGRGIAVCPRWDSFEAFLSDMSRRPSPHHSLDRIDVDGGYCPENCRWATRIEQNNNARSNIILTFQGKTMNLAQWARSTGIDEWTLRSRLGRLGWSIERSLTEPVKRRSTKKASQA
jgi:hypothetical protein